MWAVREKSKPPAAAPRDPHPAGLLSIATRLSVEPGSGPDGKVVTRIYHRVREALSHVPELEAGQLKGERERDEAYFEGKRQANGGRATAGKNVVFGLLERDGRVSTKSVESVRPDRPIFCSRNVEGTIHSQGTGRRFCGDNAARAGEIAAIDRNRPDALLRNGNWPLEADRSGCKDSLFVDRMVSLSGGLSGSLQTMTNLPRYERERFLHTRGGRARCADDIP